MIICLLFYYKPLAQEKKVYLESSIKNGFVIKDNKSVNLFISSDLVKCKKLNNAIALYLSSFFNRDCKLAFEEYLKNRFKIDRYSFVNKYQKQICNVIYFLEHVKHGNLPFYYGIDAYILLENNELKPCIDEVKWKLRREGKIILIEEDANKPLDDLTRSSKSN